MQLEVHAKPYVGRYPFVPLEEMTSREWGWITEHTGYMPLKVEEALAGGDPRLVTMLAVIALARAGRVSNGDVGAAYDRLIDQPAFTTVDFVADDAEPDAGPPPPRTDASSPSSGDGSTVSSDSSAAAPNGSGHPPSVSSRLPPARSGI